MMSHLFAATIGTFNQMLPAAAGIIDKAEEHCKQNAIAPEAMVNTALIDGMFPLGKQFEQVMCHSSGAITGIRSGTFMPTRGDVSGDFDTLRKYISEAQEGIAGVTPEELDSLAAGRILFDATAFQLNFTVPDFLLSFSLPNFYFHLTTAYNILRSQGVGIGKLDYIGQMRVQP